MVNVNFSLTGGNGDKITFDNENFVLNTGLSGISSIPATQVRIDPSAGNGGVWRNSKRGVRDVDLPITVLGSDRADVESKLRRLARLTQDALGVTVLAAEYSDDTSLTLGLHFVGGAEVGAWGSDTGSTWCKWVMSFQAPTPFWESTTRQTFSVSSGNTGRGLLPELARLKVSSSQALGTVSITNSGDVAAYPVWSITGPITDLSITSGSLSFGFNTPLTSGQTITIDTETGLVTNDAGANSYSILNAAPKLFAIQPGTSTITVLGTETTSATRVSCSYALRYEVVH
jgi:hypothetical protein